MTGLCFGFGANNNGNTIYFGQAFKARCQIDTVTHGRIIKSLCGAHVAHGCYARVEAHTNGKVGHAFLLPSVLVVCYCLAHLQGRMTGAGGLVGKWVWGTKQHHDGITNVFIYGALLF